MSDNHFIPADHDTVCEWCGCYAMDHGYEQLARECYPKRVDALEAKILRMETALQVMCEAPYEQPIGCWFGVIKKALAP